VLWRRSKLGLKATPDERIAIHHSSCRCGRVASGSRPDGLMVSQWLALSLQFNAAFLTYR